MVRRTAGLPQLLKLRLETSGKSGDTDIPLLSSVQRGKAEVL